MMMLRCSLLLLVSVFCCSSVQGAAIPIWELLSHEEKLGRLFYVFVHLVQQYCKNSDIPDCPKVLTLYGLSNLVSEDEHSLDLMDPYQRDAKIIVWERIMRGEFKLPAKVSGGKAPRLQQVRAGGAEVGENDVDSTPYQVRVRPPVDFVPSKPVAAQQINEAAPANPANPSKTLILRLGRSLADSDDQSTLSLLPEDQAHWLNTQFLH